MLLIGIVKKEVFASGNINNFTLLIKYNKKEACNMYSRLQYYMLISILKRCYKFIPFYKNLLDSCDIKYTNIKSLKDINLLPFTEKTDLINNYPFGSFATNIERIVRIHQSSGTHGIPKVIGYTRKDLKNWQNICSRILNKANCSKTDIIQIAFNYGLFTGGLGFHAGAEKLGLTVIPVSSNNTEKQISLLKDMQTSVLCCTPSYAVYLAQTMKESNINFQNLNLKKVILGAETLADNTRLQIENLLGVEVYNTYGLSEMYGPGVAFECQCHLGMHINEDYFFPEIIDPKTLRKLGEGEIGELVLTTLRHEAMPLLRYRTGDLASIYVDKCACGCKLIKMSNPIGRIDDMFIVKGVNIFPTQIEDVLFAEISNIIDYKIIVDKQNNKDTILVEVELSNKKNISKEKIEKIKKVLRNALCVKVDIAIIDVLQNSKDKTTKNKSNHLMDKRKI